jgi:Protein of unknown function (DUF3987)
VSAPSAIIPFSGAEAAVAAQESPPVPNNADKADFGIDEDEEIEFPADCLPAVIRNMAEEVSRSKLAPLTLSAACALGTVSAALGAGLQLETEGEQTVRGNLFIAAVAPSGTGKGAASGDITAPFREFEQLQIDNWQKVERPAQQARAEVLEQQIKALKKQAAKIKEADAALEDLTNRLKTLKEEQGRVEKKLEQPCMIVGDATQEALTSKLWQGKNEALASISSEARNCVDVLCGRYSTKTDESIYISAWSGDPVTRNRMGSPPVILRRPCLALLWLFQPDKLEMLLESKAMTTGGFLPRFLVFDTKASPQEEPAQRSAVPPAVAKAWRDRITEITTTWHQADSPAILHPSVEVKEIMRNYKNDIVRRRKPGGELDDVGEYAARWCENAWRLIPVLHAAEHGARAMEQPVSERAAENAILLMKWFARQQLQILSSVRAKKKRDRLDQLIALLTVEAEHSLSLRLLKRDHNFTQEEVEFLASKYPDKLVIEDKAAPSGRGRPSRVVRTIDKWR